MTAYCWLFGAVVLDVCANWALMKSDGFEKLLWGIFAVSLISLAFVCLGQAILVIPLSIAYAVWAALGIFGTLMIGRVIFHQHLTVKKYIAVTLLTVGVVCINIA